MKINKTEPKVSREDKAYRGWLNGAPLWVRVLVPHNGSTIDCALYLAFMRGRRLMFGMLLSMISFFIITSINLFWLLSVKQEAVKNVVSIRNTEIYCRAYFEGVDDTLASIVIGEGGTGNIELVEMRNLLEKRMRQYNIDMGIITK